MEAPRPERRALVRSALAALLIAVLTAGASSTAALLKIDDVLPDARPGDIIPDVSVVPPEPGDPQTILLLGSDRRWHDEDDDPVRSDTMMLVRLDPRQPATTVLSIPRDLHVSIPGHGVAKINDAYALGGPKLAVETVTQLTGLEINHVANVNFGGFRRAINLFGCFWVDVDRRYYHSNEGVPIGQRYAAIDIPPGYQRLCGRDSLAYVRHRHTDSDLVRAARQQDFLRAAKDQMSTSSLINDLERLGEILGRSVQANAELRSKAGFIRLAKLGLDVAEKPVRQIEFPATFVRTEDEEGERVEDYVESSPAAIAKAVEAFMHGGDDGGGDGASGDRKRDKITGRAPRRRVSIADAGLVEARAAALEHVGGAGGRVEELGFPLRFPSHLTPRGRYEELRIYPMRDRAGTLERAYRFVVVENKTDGQFYGVQGTSWRNPPLLANPSSVRRVRGRRLELFRSGGRLRFVAWRTQSGAYWISNTLNLELSNDEMLALAASLTTAK